MKRCLPLALACMLAFAPATLAGDQDVPRLDLGLAVEWLVDLWQQGLSLWASPDPSHDTEAPSPLWDSIGPGLVPVGSDAQAEDGNTLPDLTPADPDSQDEIGPGLVPVG